MVIKRRNRSGTFPIDWTKTFERNSKPLRKPGCWDCYKNDFCSNCVIEPEMKYFTCDLERACETCLGQISKKKFSTE